MEYKRLGHTGLKVSRLILGTMNFGELTDEKTAFAIMDRALEAGINTFDTADVYGGPQSPDMKQGFGKSEEIVGRWLQKTGNRQRIVLATKGYQPMGLGVNDRGLSAYHLRQAVAASLRRLQTDHIDLYQMHHIDSQTSWAEIWSTMTQLQQSGQIIYVGSSNFAGWNIATAQKEAEERHLLGLASEQSLYNLSNRALELEVIPALRYYQIGLIVWSPIGMGLLAGNFDQSSHGRRRTADLEGQIQVHQQQLAEYQDLCRQIGEEPSVVALAWLLQNPVVTAPITGPRTVEQLDKSLHALDVQLSPDVLQRLDKIWPGPGGPAPQAYAW
ncbi:aldo/keto reductase [Lactobacillus sp. DCY120]|uniref:Aldo/keto reductase n=1 Tax=Bombilactobacillus apium TaxID=2675299 RepID=A0A850RBS5_9LACO|nr:aldo/keto reductase [Bombilactobacillus apium]NVY96766.1 aldo/keto reductase [Bombilactobacillus apium]